MSPLQLFYNLDKAVQFEPPPPWLAPLDSLTISWDPLRGVESNLLGISWFSNECAFLIETTDKAVVQAEATVNLVGIYAAADTVIVWGTEFGWPDHHLLEERPTWPSPVEDRTWGQLKHMMYPENGANR